MNNDEYRSLIDQEIAQAVSWSDSTIADEQARNLAYYLGLPMGNEINGRSQLVSWDVFEVVEAAMPTFLEAFFAGDDVVQFEPVGREDEQFADQASDYLNHIIKKRNPGFQIFSTWLKDGLLSKIGIVRTYWDKTQPEKKESYTGLTDMQLTMLAEEEGVEIVKHSEYPDPDADEHLQQALQQRPDMAEQLMTMPVPMLHDIEIKRLGRARGVRVENVPPETFVISRSARTIEDAPVVGEMRRYSRSTLVEMGYSKAQVAALSDYDSSGVNSTIRLIRDEDTDDEHFGQNEYVTLFYGFVRADRDGDGIAELRRVLLAGNDTLEDEEADEDEYAVWTPIPLPHRVIGMAYADPVAPLQQLNTALTRQYVDSLFLANNPRTYVQKGQVDIETVLNNRIGGIVTGTAAYGTAIGPLQTANVARDALQGVEWANSQRETRIGITRYNQGLDTDSLNKTATGIQKIFSAADKRQKMTLRIFAETGVKTLFRKMLKLVTAYQDKGDVIRLRNQWVEFSPAAWNADMDVSINVGLGTGDKTEIQQQLMGFGAWMGQAMQMGMPFVTPQNMYELGRNMARSMPIPGATEALLTAPEQWQPPQPPPPSPEQIIAEAQVKAKEIDANTRIQEAQMKHSQSLEQMAMQREIEQAKLAQKEVELQLRQLELGMKAAQAAEKAQLDRSKETRETLETVANIHGQARAAAASDQQGAEGYGGPQR